MSCGFFDELGLPYELETFQLGDKQMRAPEYLKVHPLGRVLAFEDDDGVRVLESGAIGQYMLAKHGGGRMMPEVSSPEFGQYLQWRHDAAGEYHLGRNHFAVTAAAQSGENW